VTLTLIRNANLYAPQPLGIRHLLLGGGRILWIGEEALDLPVALRTVTSTIDAAGRRTIPGLIDGHVHVTGGGGEAGFRTRVPAVPLSRFTTAGITTVVGLLGTVVGVINAFAGIGSTGSAGLGAVSAGISEALIETALGLVVAIPAVWLYNYFSGSLEYFNVEMDNSSSELVDFFIKKTA